MNKKKLKWTYLKYLRITSIIYSRKSSSSDKFCDSIGGAEIELHNRKAWEAVGWRAGCKAESRKGCRSIEVEVGWGDSEAQRGPEEGSQGVSGISQTGGKQMCHPLNVRKNILCGVRLGKYISYTL